MERIQQSLTHRLRSSVLNATERVAAGLHLAKIGDPRQEVLDLVNHGVLSGPPGLFFSAVAMPTLMPEMMRSKALADITWIIPMPSPAIRCRWRIRQYVEASGNSPGDADWSLGPANTPVVWVSMHEAIAFSLPGRPGAGSSKAGCRKAGGSICRRNRSGKKPRAAVKKYQYRKRMRSSLRRSSRLYQMCRT